MSGARRAAKLEEDLATLRESLEEEVVELGRDFSGREEYLTNTMVEVEEILYDVALELGVDLYATDGALTLAQKIRDKVLG